MSVFATGPHRVTEATHYQPGGHFWVAEEFIEQLRMDPTPEKLNQLLETCPHFDLGLGQSRDWTALAVAISERSLPLIRRILELRPDLLNKSCYSKREEGTPLSMAAFNEDAEFSLRAVEELLARGADINLADGRGGTPLFNSALRADHIAVTRALLESGGVIYEVARGVPPQLVEKWVTHDGRRYVDVIAEQPANIAAALATLEGVSRFAQGRLYDNPAHPMNRLPLELCREAASFVVPTSYLNE